MSSSFNHVRWFALFAASLACASACAVQVEAEGAGADEDEPEPAIEPVAQALTNPLGQFAVRLDDATRPLREPYTPPAAYRLNVSSVMRMATGEYAVVLPEVVRPSVVSVVAYGSDNTRCSVMGTEDDHPFFRGAIWVRCHTPSGTTADSRFVLNGFLIGFGLQGRVGGGLVRGDGTLLKSFNTQGTVAVSHPSPGNYKISLGNLGSGARGGTVQITSHLGTANHCKVVSWGAELGAPTTQTIQVRCFAPSSDTATDTGFWFLYDEEIPTRQARGAYSWANDATSSSYQPTSLYTFMHGPAAGATSSSATGSLMSGETGRYRMVYHGLNETVSSEAYVFAGAYGSGSDYCKVRSWTLANGCASNCDIEVQTLCFDKAGARKNTKYVQTWGSFRSLIPQ